MSKSTELVRDESFQFAKFGYQWVVTGSADAIDKAIAAGGAIVPRKDGEEAEVRMSTSKPGRYVKKNGDDVWQYRGADTAAFVAMSKREQAGKPGNGPVTTRKAGADEILSVIADMSDEALAALVAKLTGQASESASEVSKPAAKTTRKTTTRKPATKPRKPAPRKATNADAAISADAVLEILGLVDA